MSRMTVEEEIAAIKKELIRLEPIITDLYNRLSAIDAVRHKISLAYSTAWSRRDRIDRRLFALQRKIKVCKPCGERKPTVPKSIDTMLASLTPAQKEALRIILLKGEVK